MRAAFRLLLVVVALSTSGAGQRVANITGDPCCADESPSAPDCPPGASCACCPARSSVPQAAAEIRPIEATGYAVAPSAREPVISASQSDIFHPPRR